MEISLRRAAAASLPIAVLAVSALASDAAPVVQVRAPAVRVVRPFIQPFASAPMALGGGATLPIPAYLGHSESSGTVSTGSGGLTFRILRFSIERSERRILRDRQRQGQGGFRRAGRDGKHTVLQRRFRFDGDGVRLCPAQRLQSALPRARRKRRSTRSIGLHDVRKQQSQHAARAGRDSLDHRRDRDLLQNAVRSHQARQFLERTDLRHLRRIDEDVSRNVDARDAGLSRRRQRYELQFLEPLSDAAKQSGNPDCGNFSGNQTFTMADPQLPKNAVGATGNSGVVAAVESGPAGSIGYAEAGYVTHPASGTNYGTVSGKNPITNLPEAAASIRYVSGSTIFTDQAVVQQTGPAGHTPLTGVPTAGCVQLVNPSAYALPTSGYPIVAVTYLLFSHNGNSGHNVALQQLITDLNTPTDFAGGRIVTINKATTSAGTGTTGYAALGSSFNSPLTRVARSCIGAYGFDTARICSVRPRGGRLLPPRAPHSNAATHPTRLS